MIRNIYDNNYMYYNMYFIIFFCLWIKVFNIYILVYDLFNNDVNWIYIMSFIVRYFKVYVLIFR